MKKKLDFASILKFRKDSPALSVGTTVHFDSGYVCKSKEQSLITGKQTVNDEINFQVLVWARLAAKFQGRDFEISGMRFTMTFYDPLNECFGGVSYFSY